MGAPAGTEAAGKSRDRFVRSECGPDEDPDSRACRMDTKLADQQPPDSAPLPSVDHFYCYLGDLGMLGPHAVCGSDRSRSSAGERDRAETIGRIEMREVASRQDGPRGEEPLKPRLRAKTFKDDCEQALIPGTRRADDDWFTSRLGSSAGSDAGRRTVVACSPRRLFGGGHARTTAACSPNVRCGAMTSEEKPARPERYERPTFDSVDPYL
jgi:hypothetical protein